MLTPVLAGLLSGVERVQDAKPAVECVVSTIGELKAGRPFTVVMDLKNVSDHPVVLLRYREWRMPSAGATVWMKRSGKEYALFGNGTLWTTYGQWGVQSEVLKADDFVVLKPGTSTRVGKLDVTAVWWVEKHEMGGAKKSRNDKGAYQLYARYAFDWPTEVKIDAPYPDRVEFGSAEAKALWAKAWRGRVEGQTEILFD